MSNSVRPSVEVQPVAAKSAAQPSAPQQTRPASDYRGMGPGDLHPNELYA